MAVKIDNVLLDTLTAQAKESPRLRMNYDLRNSSADTSQRMLNAIEPGSAVPVHRHRTTSETVVVLRGRVVEEFYDDLECTCTAAYEISPSGPVCALNIPAGTWHTLRSLESGTVILEVKDGAYVPIGPEDVLEIGQASAPAASVDPVAPGASVDPVASGASVDPGITGATGVTVAPVASSGLAGRIRELIEMESRSGSMDPALITPEYVFRLLGGKLPLEDIEKALKEL